MFGYKSAGIVKELANALSRNRAHGVHGRGSTTAIAPEMPGVARNNESYIAPAQFTVVAMPFFRWSQ